MGNIGQRHNRRYKVAIRATVSDRQQQNSIRCMIRDGSISGCKIISRQVPDLPEKVLINVPNLNQLIKGRIVWRNHDSAGIEFKWETKHPDERRRAPRQEVCILATLMDHNYKKLSNCMILDASRTGCRISSDAVAALPDDIHIEIPGLTDPVLALIVWRNGNMAGLEFLWGSSDVYMLEDAFEV